MGTLQNITVAGLIADLGLAGYNGLTAAVHTSDHTKLDITVTRPAWALLFDGTLLTTELVTTTVKAPTTDGTYHLYLDAQDTTTAIIPNWTIATTEPSARALQVGDVVVSSGTISAVPLYPAGLRNFPVVGGAPLVWRGPFDPQGQYAPGHLVRAGSQLYVCTDAPEKVLDTRTDTFIRPDQAGWGTASDGNIWIANGFYHGSTESISGNRGLTTTPDGNVDSMTLGPPLAGSNVEALVRWQMTVSLASNDGLDLRLPDSIVLVEVLLDGSYTLVVSSQTPSGGQPTWAGGDSAHSYWTRARLEDGTLSVRTWQDGGSEPGAWDCVFASGQSIIPGQAVLLNAGYNHPTTLAIDHFSVIMLAEGLPWPGSDPVHWALMAG